MPIQWTHFPKSTAPPLLVTQVVKVFQDASPQISSENHRLKSNEVLQQVTPKLLELGFDVETGKRKSEKVYVPVLYGLNGTVEKAFEADAFHKQGGCVVEVEAGRAVVNNQFLKDLFQASMMEGVSILVIAVRNIYEGGSLKSKDFQRVNVFFETLYASNRIKLPLEYIAVIGY